VEGSAVLVIFKQKNLFLFFVELVTNMAAVLLSFNFQEIGCNPPILAIFRLYLIYQNFVYLTEIEYRLQYIFNISVLSMHIRISNTVCQNSDIY
jgi:hypothetical protein